MDKEEHTGHGASQDKAQQQTKAGCILGEWLGGRWPEGRSHIGLPRQTEGQGYCEALTSMFYWQVFQKTNILVCIRWAGGKGGTNEMLRGSYN